MKHIMKNMIPYWKSVLLIVLLLLCQAYGDLALPQYTSNIIDTGIQNKGISHIVPEKIMEEDFENVESFMNDEEKAIWEDCFEQKDGLYQRKAMRESELNDADEHLLIPVVLEYQIINMLSGEGSVEESASMFDGMSAIPENINPELALTMIKTPPVLKAIRDKFSSVVDTIGSSTLKSMGVAWTAQKEAAAGIDLKEKQMNYLWASGAKMLGIALLLAVLSVLISLLAARVGAGIGKNLRRKVFHNVIRFSNREIDQFSTASLITRSTNDVQQIQIVSIILLRMIFYAPILGIGGIIKVIQNGSGMGWIIALAVIVIMGLVMLLMVIAMPKFKMMQKLIDRLNLVSREILTGLSVIRAFGREKTEEDRFNVANTNLMRTQLFTNRVMTFMMPAMMTILYAINILIVWTAAHKIDAGMIQVGTMTAFITYTMQIVMSFLMLTMMSIMLPRAGVAAERIAEVIETESSIVDPRNPVELKNHQGVVEFRDVSFRYPNAKADVLEHISFVAEPGKTTAIIGSTGCGKSTLVNLIPRLYDVTDGQILIDGIDIRSLTMKQLREGLGFVPQKAVLFSGTIASNIRFGVQDASREVMEEAAEIAQAKEFIDGKTKGYDSSISQGGSNVSGGQKQRLAIARAIAKHPKVLIFDDSFSALDMKTDAALRKALEEKTADSTVIIVAQRISTIIHADQILVLDEGQIVGRGTHEELIRNCEVYLQIARSQLSAKELGLEEDESTDENLRASSGDSQNKSFENSSENTNQKGREV